jgi:hypothetical protein
MGIIKRLASEDYVTTEVTSIVKKELDNFNGNGVNIENAEVDQVLIIKTVDENGIPTEYEGMTVIDGNTVLFYADGNEVVY